MYKTKHFVQLTKECQQQFVPKAMRKLTYQQKGTGFEVEKYSLENPFLHSSFPKKKYQLSLCIPLSWVQYIVSSSEDKSLGFLFKNQADN